MYILPPVFLHHGIGSSLIFTPFAYSTIRLPPASIRIPEPGQQSSSPRDDKGTKSPTPYLLLTVISVSRPKLSITFPSLKFFTASATSILPGFSSLALIYVRPCPTRYWPTVCESLAPTGVSQYPLFEHSKPIIKEAHKFCLLGGGVYCLHCISGKFPSPQVHACTADMVEQDQNGRKPE